jgi:STE24 endopeptidase
MRPRLQRIRPSRSGPGGRLPGTLRGASPLKEPPRLLPDLTVLVALLMGLWSLDGPPPEDPGRTLLGTALCILVASALSRMAVQRGVRALREDDPLMGEASVRWVVTWPLLGWIASLGLFDWGGLVMDSVPRIWWMASLVVLFLPALIMFGFGWVGRAQLQARIITERGGVPMPSQARVVLFREIKRNLLIFIPMLVILGLTEAIWVLGELGVEPLRVFALWLNAMPLLNIGIILILMLLALPFIPRIFSRALKAVPLEAGPLRETLERCARSIDLEYHDIMVWPTGGRVFNAMVVGFTPKTRTIFLTDGLMNVMPEEEIVAVFFHEAGHAKRQHLLLFLVSFFALTLIFHAATLPLIAIGIPLQLQVLLHLAVIWFGLLGWVSRRFERESDIFGAEHAGILDPDTPPIVVPGLPAPLPRGAAMMMRALERIRSIVGRGGSHRHGTVEERVTYVANYATDPATKRAFQNGRRLLLAGLLGLVALAVALTALRMPLELALAEAQVEAESAMTTYQRAWRLAHGDGLKKDPTAARKAYREAYDRLLLASRRLEGLDDTQSRSLRVQHTYNAADTAQHGLGAPDLARTGFENTLALINALPEEERTQTYASLLAFHCHIELGRLSAWAYAALPEGSDDRDLGETLDHIRAAKELRLAYLDGSEMLTQAARTLLGERMRLLVATYEAVRGETAEARRALRQLAQLGGDSVRWKDRDAIEIREDAQRELNKLPD